MRTTKYILVLVTVLIFSSCDDNSSGLQDSFTIEGTVFYNNMRLKNASITLDKQNALSTLSDNDGNFKIPNVPKGDHNLGVSKTFSDGSFVEINSNIVVNEDIILSSLTLPRAVFLYEPMNTTATSTDLSWSSTDAIDFREYKIFSHNSSGLDENTGSLIHISTAIDDTNFTDSGLNPLSEYYYRVYVMNEYGRLGGSNIVHTSTPTKNLFPDGGLELSTNFSDNWIIDYGPPESGEISDSMSYEGASSLHLTLPSHISHKLMPGAEAGEIYEFSFWYRVTGDSVAYTQFDDRSLSIKHFDGSHVAFVWFGIFIDENPDEPFDTGWLFHKEYITMIEDTPVTLSTTLGSTTIGLQMWFDNFVLKKVSL